MYNNRVSPSDVYLGICKIFDITKAKVKIEVKTANVVIVRTIVCSWKLLIENLTKH